MKKFKLLPTFLVAIAAASLVSACGKSRDADSAFSDESSLLRYVPADSAYLFAKLGPMPADYTARVKPQMDIINAENRKLVERAILGGRDDRDELTPELEDMLELFTDLNDLMSTGGLESAGIGPDSQLVVYAQGILPVLRIELRDVDAFNAKVAALLQRVDVELETAQLGGTDYRYLTLDKLRLLLLVDDGQAVISASPSDYSDEQLTALLGLELPAKNIAAEGVLADIAERYDFKPHYVGFSSTEKLLAAGLASGGLIDQALVDAGRGSINDMLSDTCRAEFTAMSAIAPRVVLGVRRADATRVDSSVIVELREDIAAGLEGLASPVPGLGTLDSGLLTFGMSFNAKVARDFAEQRFESIVAEPFDCEFMAGINTGATQALEFIKRQPVPPTAYDFKGFILSIEDIEGLKPGTPPTDVKARASGLLAIDNPESLMALGNMFVPEIAALNLTTDGEIVPLPSDTGSRMSMSAESYISMSKNAIGVAAGDGGDQRLAALMALPPNEDAPLLYANVDAGAYITLVSNATQMGLADSGQDDVMTSTQAMLDAVGELYDRMSVDVRITEHGVEMNSLVTLKP